MNKDLDINSNGQHWIKNNEYWCSFDYYGELTVVKCCWSTKQENCLVFEIDPKKEQSIKNVSIEWFDDAEYFDYIPTISITEEDFKPRKRKTIL